MATAADRKAEMPDLWRPEARDPDRGGLPAARRRPLSGKAGRGRGARSVGRRISRRPRQAERGRQIPARRRAVARGAARLLRQRPLGRPLSARSGRIAGITRSKPGPTASRAGARKSKKSAMPGRTSRSSCWRGGRSSRKPRQRPRRPIRPRSAHCCANSTRRRRCSHRFAAVDADPGADGALLAASGPDAIPARVGSRRRPRGGALCRLVRNVPAQPGARARKEVPPSMTASPGCRDIAALGFDVVYLAPIHPIGRVNRKGRDNAPTRRRAIPAAPTRSAPARAATAPSIRSLAPSTISAALSPPPPRTGMEVALDFAVQCAPDHPWVREHPRMVSLSAGRHDQIRREPAQEIPGHRQRRFLQPATARRCGRELRDVVLFWVAQGVRIFRVDNPAHQAGAVLGMADPRGQGALPRRDLSGRGLHPAEDDAAAGEGRLHPVLHLFHLAQHEAGADRIPDRADAGCRQESICSRNFFTNTPDILPEFLQEGGRPAFRIRAGSGGDLVAGLRHL